MYSRYTNYNLSSCLKKTNAVIIIIILATFHCLLLNSDRIRPSFHKTTLWTINIMLIHSFIHSQMLCVCTICVSMHWPTALKWQMNSRGASNAKKVDRTCYELRMWALTQTRSAIPVCYGDLLRSGKRSTSIFFLEILCCLGRRSLWKMQTTWNDSAQFRHCYEILAYVGVFDCESKNRRVEHRLRFELDNNSIDRLRLRFPAMPTRAIKNKPNIAY